MSDQDQTMKYRNVGFDVRRGGLSQWPQKRRRMYLLRDDVLQPFSTDRTVWESATVDDPAWHGVLDLWSDLSQLRQNRTRLGAQGSDITISIALPWDILTATEVSIWSSPQKIEATKPPNPEPSWRLLGYDVSDDYLLSGLSNCGYDSESMPKLRQTWGPLLNEHHLFVQISDALSFRAFTNTRVREHAPFHVFALFVVPDG